MTAGGSWRHGGAVPCTGASKQQYPGFDSRMRHRSVLWWIISWALRTPRKWGQTPGGVMYVLLQPVVEFLLLTLTACVCFLASLLPVHGRLCVSLRIRSINLSSFSKSMGMRMKEIENVKGQEVHRPSANIHPWEIIHFDWGECEILENKAC